MDQATLFPGLETTAPRETPSEAPLEVRGEVEFREIGVGTALNRYRGGGMPFDYTLNPYRGCEFGCGYCYARYTHDFLDRDGGSAWDREILVKTRLVEALRAELRSGRLRGRSIAIGTATDPYQPAERRYGITRAALEELSRHRGLRVSVTTKSSLVARDLDLLVRLRDRGEATVNLSLVSLDRRLLRRLEPRAPTPERRLWAMRRLAEAGVRVGLFLMPILPGLVDDDASLEAVIAAAAEAGASFVVADPLFLRSAARRTFLPIVERDFPDEAGRYQQWYGRSAYAPRGYRDRLRARVRTIARRHGLGGGRRRDRDSTGPANASSEQYALAL